MKHRNMKERNHGQKILDKEQRARRELQVVASVKQAAVLVRSIQGVRAVEDDLRLATAKR